MCCSSPGQFILFDIDHGVFDRFVYQRVHAGDEEIDGTQQGLPISGQKFLCLRIVAKLLLKNINTIKS